MRAINANNVSGSEAILIAAVRWWASLPANRERVTTWARGLSDDAFAIEGETPNKTQYHVGVHVVKIWKGLPSLVWSEVRRDSGLRFAIDLALREGGMSLDDDFAPLVGTAVGAMLLESGEYDRFHKRVLRYRKDKKTVKKIMES